MQSRMLRIVSGMAVLVVGVWLVLTLVPPARVDTQWGVTFSKKHAEFLGLDWRTAYTALFEDLGVRRVRIGAYWNDVQPTERAFAWDDLDAMLEIARAHGATVVLAVGMRLPRWPECHVPGWVSSLSFPTEEERWNLVEDYVRTVVERYRGHPAIAMWQVENEPLLRLFGECPGPDRARLAREVAIVRDLDPQRPVLITDSGELSLWLRTSRIGDRLGTTMYRVVWNRFIGYWSYDWLLPPAFYRLKAWVAGVPTPFMVIAELQAEPWLPEGDPRDVPLAELQRAFDADRFRRHLAFARATGFREVYLWGAEYWYWLAQQGDSSLWEAAREALTAAP